MTHRRAMTDARKRRIHKREGGVCYHCGEHVPMFGPDVRYDHRVGVWFTERDEDADVSPAHTTCDAPKTAGDATKRAKTKRLIRNEDPIARAAHKAKKRHIANRGFEKPKTKPKWPQRPFPKRRP